MLHDRQVIALCTARIQNSEILESVRAFVEEARRRDDYVLVLNSSLQEHVIEQEQASCYSVYDLIPFSIVDIIVIMRETIRNDAVCNTIAALAKEHRIPVMCYDSVMDGVPSVCSYAHEAFPAVLEHILGDHGCRHVNLITGVRGDYGSECMVMAYTEALRAHGLPYREERVGYGDYWDEPAAAVVKRFLAQEELPDAIICANDTMAIAACAVLREHGLHVPDDIIVTGCDGIVMERYYTPRLTTCARDYERMTVTALDTAEMILDGEEVPMRTEIAPVMRLSESCGCRVTEERDQNPSIRLLVRKLTISAIQEENASGILCELMDRKQATVIDYLDVMSTHLSEDAVLCLRDSLSADLQPAALQEFADSSELMSTVSYTRKEKRFSIVPRAQLIPNLETVFAAGRAVYISSVYLRREVYGYYAYYGTELEEESFKLPKLIHTFGNVIGSHLVAARLFAMNERLIAARVRDSLTGMLNLHGAMKQIGERIANEADDDDRLVMLVIGLRKLRQINSIFGHTEGDQALLSLANAIQDCIDSDTVAARVGGDEFLLAYFCTDNRTDSTDALIDVLKKRMESYNQVSGKSYSIEIAIGYATAPVTAGISLDGLLNEAIARKENENIDYRPDGRAAHSDPGEMDRIISENLLTYHFQPIVSTKTGQIFAYEALMRAVNDRELSPLTLLRYAANAGRLYEIEWLTYYNVLRHMRENGELFAAKRIFVNSIPGHFISDADFAKLCDQFGDLLPQLVVEFTEQAETEGEELRQIQARCAAHNMDIAVDDYGTGYSNITNLLRYSPNYVKIDHSLISSIHEDPKKQHFVTNIIEFAHANGFMALAEGVETMDELRAVIRFGADLVQGNFTAKPSAVPIETIDPTLSAIIVRLSSVAAKQFLRKTFMTSGERSVRLRELERDNYTDIFMAQPELEVVGDFNTPCSLIIKVKDNTDCRIVLRDVYFYSANQLPVIQIGRNCNVTLDFEGDNRVDNGGILVPESSTLCLTGRGNLSISTNQYKSYAIGNDADFSCGNIKIDLAGILQIVSNGDQAIGIGAGLGRGQLISVTGTRVFIQMSGIEGIGIGSLEGATRIEFAGCVGNYDLSFADGSGIGAYHGAPTVRCDTVDFTFSGSGKSITCIGSLNGGGSIVLTESALASKLTGQNLIALGSSDAKPEVSLRQCRIDVHFEGTRALDVGSFEKNARLTIVDTDLNIYLRSGKAMHLGAEEENLYRSGGGEELNINR